LVIIPSVTVYLQFPLSWWCFS